MSSAATPSAPDDGTTVPGLSRQRSGNALPAGARLAEFEIRSVIGEGGFGIVYLAWDGVLQRQVALKEYMPATLATRTQANRVAPRTDKSAETFALGLRSFVNEAHLLASFDHPSLLKVYRFWEANGTAYMVMPYYQGITLKRALAALDAPPEEAWLVRQLGQLLDALEVMHHGHCYHRDISPDNILLLDNGTPLLLDFGAARRVIGDATHALTAFLKPGYAPVEQYAEMPTMKQGPWTDLYALGSVVHYAITGRTPPESVARLVTDTMVPLSRSAAGRYSERFLRAIDHSLAVRPDARPQSAAGLRGELGIEERRARGGAGQRIPTAPMPLEASPPPLDDAQRLPVHPAPAPLSARPPRTATPLPAAPPRAARLVGPAWLLAAALSLTAAAALGWWALSAPDRAARPSAKPLPEPSASPPPDTAAAGSASPIAPVTAPAQEAATHAPATPPPALPAAAAAPPTPTEAVQPASAAPTLAAPELNDAARGRSAAAAASRPIPKKNSPNPRCTDIIARVSLGEALSPQDHATLERECRK